MTLEAVRAAVAWVLIDRAGYLREMADRTLDALIIEAQAEMPCAGSSIYYCAVDAIPEGIDLCPSCQTRQKRDALKAAM